MVGKKQWTKSIASGVALVLLAQAGSLLGQGPVFNRGYPNAPVCYPNVREFGYFKTEWQSWPEPPRQDQVFPQSVGVDPLPRPAAEPATRAGTGAQAAGRCRTSGRDQAV